MKAFKKLSSAQKHANGGPVIYVHSGSGFLYLAGDVNEHTEISLLAGGGYAASVICGHFNRLGNANHAVAKTGYHYDAFPNCAPSFARMLKGA